MSGKREAHPWNKVATEAQEKVASIRQEHVEDAIVAYAGNISQAAEALGIARSYMNVLLERFKLLERAKELRGGRGAGRPKTRTTRKLSLT